jgi:hypothetical protein
MLLNGLRAELAVPTLTVTTCAWAAEAPSARATTLPAKSKIFFMRRKENNEELVKKYAPKSSLFSVKKE